MPKTRRPRPRFSSGSTGPFLRGAVEALLVPLAFVALGLGSFGLGSWGGAAPGAGASPAPYSGSIVDDAQQTPPVDPELETWLVDGFNVVQVGLLGGRDRSEWWTGPRRFELMARAEAFEHPDAAVWVVFDGGRAADPEDSTRRARPVFVPSADDWMVARVRSAPDPGQVTVVTADRRLAGRVRHHGGRVASPGEFLGLCPARPNWGEFTSI